MRILPHVSSALFLTVIAGSANAQTVIWSDDFSNATNWNMEIWPGAPNVPWTIGTQPAQGDFALPEISSTTAGNGYALLDSDFYMNFFEMESSTLTMSSPVDLSGFPNLLLEFETFYQRFTGEECYVVLSTNNADWPDLDPYTDISGMPNVFRVFPGMQDNGITDDPALISIDIAAFAGQPQVWIRFHWTGTGGYAWYIDDIVIREQLEYDLELIDCGISAGSSGIRYGRTPSSLLAGSYEARATVHNHGFGSPTNMELELEILDPNGDPVHESSAASAAVSPADTVQVTHQFNLGQLPQDLYTVNMSITSDQEPAGSSIGLENTITRTFEVTADRYSIDNIGNHPVAELVTSIGSNSFVGAANGLMLMSQYNLASPITIHGLEVLLSSGTQAGGALYYYLYDSTDIDPFSQTPDLTIPVAQGSGPYTITSQDITNGILQLAFPSPVTLQPGSYYGAVELYEGVSQSSIRVMDDETVEQPAWASLIYIPDDQIYSNGNAFAIRLITEPASPPCQALFNVTQGLTLPDSVPVPGLLWITDASSGGSGSYSYSWDMGDGTIYNEPTPYHDYATNGPYDLCLTIDDGAGCMDTYCQSIWVDDEGIIFGFTFNGSRNEGFGVQVLPAPISTELIEEAGLGTLNIWPNPASDRISVSIHEADGLLIVTDAIGRQVKEYVPRMGINILDVSALPAGSYQLIFVGEAIKATTSFVRIH